MKYPFYLNKWILICKIIALCYQKSIIRNQNLELQKYIYSSFGPLASMHQLQTITFCSTLWWSQGRSCFQESINLHYLSFSYCFFRSLVSPWVTFSQRDLHHGKPHRSGQTKDFRSLVSPWVTFSQRDLHHGKPHRWCNGFDFFTLNWLCSEPLVVCQWILYGYLR